MRTAKINNEKETLILEFSIDRIRTLNYKKIKK